MNEPSRPSSWVCRIVRWRASWAEDPSASSAPHCAHCEACRVYFAAGERLESALRMQAAQRKTPAPSGLESRILVALRDEAEPVRTAPMRRVARTGWAVAAVAAGLVLALGILRLRQSPNPVAPAQGASVEDVVAVANTLPLHWLSTAQPRALQLVNDNALQREALSVRNDADSALRFLATNFLPAQATDQPSRSENVDTGERS